ncbi:MAG: hypothetical protein AAGN35_22170 [Bacteroidota bacterium]
MRTIDLYFDLTRSGYSETLEMEIRNLLAIWENLGKVAGAGAAWVLRGNDLIVRLGAVQPEALTPDRVTREEHASLMGIQLLTGGEWKIVDLGPDPRGLAGGPFGQSATKPPPP